MDRRFFKILFNMGKAALFPIFFYFRALVRRRRRKKFSFDRRSGETKTKREKEREKN